MHDTTALAPFISDFHAGASKTSATFVEIGQIGQEKEGMLIQGTVRT